MKRLGSGPFPQHLRADTIRVRVAVLSGCIDPAAMTEVTLLRPDAMLVKPPELNADLDWIAA